MPPDEMAGASPPLLGTPIPDFSPQPIDTINFNEAPPRTHHSNCSPPSLSVVPAPRFSAPASRHLTPPPPAPLPCPRGAVRGRAGRGGGGSGDGCHERQPPRGGGGGGVPCQPAEQPAGGDVQPTAGQPPRRLLREAARQREVEVPRSPLHAFLGDSMAWLHQIFLEYNGIHCSKKSPKYIPKDRSK